MSLAFPRQLCLLLLLPALVAQPETARGDYWRVDRPEIERRLAANPDGHLAELLRGLAEQDAPGASLDAEAFLALCERPEAGQAEHEALRRIATPASVTNQEREHADFRTVFMQEQRLEAGRRFLIERRELLAAAEARYGVARRDLVAVLMWESGLGEFSGDHGVFSVLLGQILFLPEARAESVAALPEADGVPASPTAAERYRFERLGRRAVANLTALLRECRARDLDPLAQQGSWAGAIGYPQFMPRSLALAVDGDADGDIDLFSWPDAVFSVAHYLQSAGRYGESELARRRALFSYNRSNAYVDGVIAYADTLWARYQGP